MIQLAHSPLTTLTFVLFQAKATCEDYNPVLPDTSTSSYYNTHMTPTPPSSTLEDLSITHSMLL